MPTPSDWLATYYPITAESIHLSLLEHSDNDPYLDLHLLLHSFRKWSGLTPDILIAHGLLVRNGVLFTSSGDRFLAIDGGSCSLCQRYCYYTSAHPCSLCPIHTHTDECSGHNNAPYHQWLHSSNPLPMLSSIRSALITLIDSTSWSSPDERDEIIRSYGFDLANERANNAMDKEQNSLGK